MEIAQLVFTVLAFIMLNGIYAKLKEIFDLMNKIDTGGLKHNSPFREGN